MLRLQKAAAVNIMGWAAQHPEVEVCGLVWATELGHRVYPLPNVHPEPGKYYRTAPRDVREAFNEMDSERGEPLAWYHSHPGGKPDPSEEDMRGAFMVGTYYLIAHPEKVSEEDQLRAGYVRQWMLSAWECVQVGVLVEAEMEMK